MLCSESYLVHTVLLMQWKLDFYSIFSIIVHTLWIACSLISIYWLYTMCYIQFKKIPDACGNLTLKMQCCILPKACSEPQRYIFQSGSVQYFVPLVHFITVNCSSPIQLRKAHLVSQYCNGPFLSWSRRAVVLATLQTSPYVLDHTPGWKEYGCKLIHAYVFFTLSYAHNN